MQTSTSFSKGLIPLYSTIKSEYFFPLAAMLVIVQHDSNMKWGLLYSTINWISWGIQLVFIICWSDGIYSWK